MIKKCSVAAALLTLLSLIATAQDAKTVISNASKAMGADNLNTIQYSGSGSDFTLGQNANPNLPWPRFNLRSFARTLDLTAPAMRHTAVRTQGNNPPRGGGGQPLAGEQNQNQNFTSASPWGQQMQIWLTPYGFLKGAAANNPTVRTQTIGGRRLNVVSYTAQNKYKLNGYINDQNLVERIETWVENPVLGDTLVEAAFTAYQDFGGVKFPTRMVQMQGGHPTLDLTVTEVKPNAPIQQPPAGQPGQAAQAAPAAAQAPTQLSQKLADGVYAITGGLIAVAVEFRDHIVVIEGPTSEARATTVIAEARRLIPNKPIRYVVNTHHHFDHSSGLPAFVAEGVTIITHAMNKPFYEKAFNAPRTLAPDKMAESKRKAKFETMTEKKVLSDGTRVVELHHVKGNLHNDGMIVAYLPRERIIVEADVFNPPAQPGAPPPNPLNPFQTNFVENLERLKLDYETIISIHAPADGRTLTKADLMRAVGKGN